MTSQQKTAQTAAAAPRAAGAITPTPTQAELNAFAGQLATGTVPPMPWFHKADGSTVDPHSFSVTVGAPTWP